MSALPRTDAHSRKGGAGRKMDHARSCAASTSEGPFSSVSTAARTSLCRTSVSSRPLTSDSRRFSLPRELRRARGRSSPIMMSSTRALASTKRPSGPTHTWPRNEASDAESASCEMSIWSAMSDAESPRRVHASARHTRTGSMHSRFDTADAVAACCSKARMCVTASSLGSAPLAFAAAGGHCGTAVCTRTRAAIRDAMYSGFSEPVQHASASTTSAERSAEKRAAAARATSFRCEGLGQPRTRGLRAVAGGACPSHHLSAVSAPRSLYETRTLDTRENRSMTMLTQTEPNDCRMAWMRRASLEVPGDSLSPAAPSVLSPRTLGELAPPWRPRGSRVARRPADMARAGDDSTVTFSAPRTSSESDWRPEPPEWSAPSKSLL
eukprot:Opistho-1_new@55779